MRICGRCKVKPRKKHLNSKWCNSCAEDLKKRPAGTLNLQQRNFAIRHAGDMTIDEIAKKLKTSRSNVKRSCRGTRFYAVNGKYKYRPKLIHKVIDHYFEYGKPATEKAFPDVNVKCIVDRPEYYGVKRIYRQVKWTDSQVVELAKMAGVVSINAQAKYFNRPRANAGSIKSVWMKKFRNSGGSVNGMSWVLARHFVTPKCPRFQTAFWSTRQRRNGKNLSYSRWLVTWVDFEKNLLPGSPKWLRDCAYSMAKFQTWLHGTNRPRQKLIKMMEKREV